MHAAAPAGLKGCRQGTDTRHADEHQYPPETSFARSGPGLGALADEHGVAWGWINPAKGAGQQRARRRGTAPRRDQLWIRE